MSKTVLFLIIQFSISTLFSSTWPIDKTLSGATTPVQSGPGSDDNKGVHWIPKSSCITAASPLDCLVSYPRHSLGKSNPCVEMQSVCSIPQADWATEHSLGESYPCVEMQSVCSISLADWATEHSLGESYPCVEMQLVCSISLADWATEHSLGESYPCVEMQSVYSTALDDWAIGEVYT